MKENKEKRKLSLSFFLSLFLCMDRDFTLPCVEKSSSLSSLPLSVLYFQETFLLSRESVLVCLPGLSIHLVFLRCSARLACVSVSFLLSLWQVELPLRGSRRVRVQLSEPSSTLLSCHRRRAKKPRNLSSSVCFDDLYQTATSLATRKPLRRPKSIRFVNHASSSFFLVDCRACQETFLGCTYT